MVGDRHPVVELKACAKINLGLRILSRRSDGYHDLITVFQRVSLADTLTLETRKDGIEYTGPALTGKPEDNLCHKAALAFRSRFRSAKGVKIHLDKVIPRQAGLGGGSSDAAAVLRGMAELNNIPLDHGALLGAAADTGSDVPFFLLDVPAALGQSRGEKLRVVKGLDAGMILVILKPDISISTEWAYRRIDRLTFDKNDIKIVVHDFLEYAGGKPTAQMTNDFEGPLFKTYPELGTACDLMMSAGAEFSGLCGSGSAIFGAFSDGNTAEKVARKFSSPWLSFICRPC